MEWVIQQGKLVHWLILITLTHAQLVHIFFNVLLNNHSISSILLTLIQKSIILERIIFCCYITCYIQFVSALTPIAKSTKL